MNYATLGAQQANPYIGGTPERTMRDTPLMDVECERLSQSIAELHASVAELLARIAPVCQPSPIESVGIAQDNASKIEATPSEVRAKLIGLRLSVEGISRLIAPVKFRIEI